MSCEMSTDRDEHDRSEALRATASAGGSRSRREEGRRASARSPSEQEGDDPRHPDRPLGEARLARSAARRPATRAPSRQRRPLAGAGAQERLETRHIESALKMASVLGEMKGAAMKIGQMASFIDVDFLPPEYREIYQEQLAKLRTKAPAMPWEKVAGGARARSTTTAPRRSSPRVRGGGLRRRLDRPGPPRDAPGRQHGRGQGPVPGDRRRARVRHGATPASSSGSPRRSPPASTRRRSPRSCASGCWRSSTTSTRPRTSAPSPAPTTATPSSTSPKVHSRLSRRRVLVSEYVEGRGFEEVKKLDQDERDIFGEIVFRFCFGSIYHLQHFNADTHPGNYLLMEDGRVAFLDFGMTKRLTPEQIQLEQRAVDAAGRDDPEALREALARPRLRQRPDPGRRRAADGAREARRRLVHGGRRGRDHPRPGDEDDRGDLRPPLGLLRPGAPRERARRRADGPPDGDRAARGAGPAARAPRTGTGSCGSGSTPTRPRPCSARRSGATSSAGAPRRRPGCRAGSRPQPSYAGFSRSSPASAAPSSAFFCSFFFSLLRSPAARL